MHQSRHHTTVLTCIIVLCMAVLLSQCTTDFEVSLIIDTPTPTRARDDAPDNGATATTRTTKQATPRPTITLTPSPTKLGDVLAPLAPTKARIDTSVVRPSETPKMLRFVRQSLAEAATCVAVRIQGIDTSGWRVTIDGLKLAGTFAADGTARICGLRAGSEFTFTV